MLAFACLCLISGCGSPHPGSSMPWNTGDRTVDSLLDRAYRIETSRYFQERQLSGLAHALDSATVGRKSWPMMAAKAFMQARLGQYEDSTALASHPGDSVSTLTSLLASPRSRDYRYLSARMKL